MESTGQGNVSLKFWSIYYYHYLFRPKRSSGHENSTNDKNSCINNDENGDKNWNNNNWNVNINTPSDSENDMTSDVENGPWIDAAKPLSSGRRQKALVATNKQPAAAVQHSDKLPPWISLAKSSSSRWVRSPFFVFHQVDKTWRFEHKSYVWRGSGVSEGIWRNPIQNLRVESVDLCVFVLSAWFNRPV